MPKVTFTQTTNKPLHIVTVIAILKHKGKYLLVQRGKDDEIFPGKWQNLGGKVEIGERVEHALQREIKEEIGVAIEQSTPPVFVQSCSWVKDTSDFQRLGLIFMFKFSRKPENITLSPELEKFAWFTYEEAKTIETIAEKSETGTLGQLKIVEAMRR